MKGSRNENDYGTIKVDIRDDVVIFTMNNPPVNQLSHDFNKDLVEAFAEANADDRMKAIVLTGTGNSFIAGADIKQLQSIKDRKDIYALAERFQQKRREQGIPLTDNYAEIIFGLLIYLGASSKRLTDDADPDELLIELLQAHDIKRILEIGCGAHCRFLASFAEIAHRAGCELTGIDLIPVNPQEEKVSEILGEREIELIEGDARDFQDEQKFDLIIASGVMSLGGDIPIRRRRIFDNGEMDYDRLDQIISNAHVLTRKTVERLLSSHPKAALFVNTWNNILMLYKEKVETFSKVLLWHEGGKGDKWIQHNLITDNYGKAIWSRIWAQAASFAIITKKDTGVLSGEPESEDTPIKSIPDENGLNNLEQSIPRRKDNQKGFYFTFRGWWEVASTFLRGVVNRIQIFIGALLSLTTVLTRLLTVARRGVSALASKGLKLNIDRGPLNKLGTLGVMTVGLGNITTDGILTDESGRMELGEVEHSKHPQNIAFDGGKEHREIEKIYPDNKTVEKYEKEFGWLFIYKHDMEAIEDLIYRGIVDKALKRIYPEVNEVNIKKTSKILIEFAVHNQCDVYYKVTYRLPSLERALFVGLKNYKPTFGKPIPYKSLSEAFIDFQTRLESLETIYKIDHNLCAKSGIVTWAYNWFDIGTDEIEMSRPAIIVEFLEGNDARTEFRYATSDYKELNTESSPPTGIAVNLGLLAVLSPTRALRIFLTLLIVIVSLPLAALAIFSSLVHCSPNLYLLFSDVFSMNLLYSDPS